MTPNKPTPTFPLTCCEVAIFGMDPNRSRKDILCTDILFSLSESEMRVRTSRRARDGLRSAGSSSMKGSPVAVVVVEKRVLDMVLLCCLDCKERKKKSQWYFKSYRDVSIHPPSTCINKREREREREREEG